MIGQIDTLRMLDGRCFVPGIHSCSFEEMMYEVSRPLYHLTSTSYHSTFSIQSQSFFPYSLAPSLQSVNNFHTRIRRDIMKTDSLHDYMIVARKSSCQHNLHQERSFQQCTRGINSQDLAS